MFVVLRFWLQPQIVQDVVQQKLAHQRFGNFFLQKCSKAHHWQNQLWWTHINLDAWDYIAVGCEEDLRWLEKEFACQVRHLRNWDEEQNTHTGEEFARSGHIRRQRRDV